MAVATGATPLSRLGAQRVTALAAGIGRVARNYVLLSGAEILAKLITFAAFTYMGRVLGPERIGNLEFTLAVMVFFTLVVDFGLGVCGAREIARDPSRTSLYYCDLVGIRMLLAAASFAVLLVVVALMRKSAEVKLLLTLYGVSLFAFPALLVWLFQGCDRMRWVAACSLIRQGVFAGLVFLFLRPTTPLAYIGVFELGSAFAVATACLYLARTRLGLGWPRPAFAWGRWREHLREGAPICLSELTWACGLYFATVLLAFVAPDKFVGWFGTSHRALMALHTFVWLYLFNLLPSISRCAALPERHLQDLLRRSLALSAWGGILVALILTALSSELLTLAYGEQFSGSGPVFGVLVWTLPAALLSGHYRYTLIAYGQQRWLLCATTLSAAVSVLLGFVLIPRFAALGAAATLLASILVNFVLVYRYTRRVVAEIALWRHLERPVAALVAAAVVLGGLRPWNAWMAAGAAGIVYLLLLALWEREELPTLFGLLPKSAPEMRREAVGAR